MAPTKQSALINLPEFARRAGIPYATFWRMKTDGKIPDPTHELGSQKLWQASVADEWIRGTGSEPVLPDAPVDGKPRRATVRELEKVSTVVGPKSKAGQAAEIGDDDG